MLRLLDPETISIIFANVEDILLTNTTFLSSLEERQRSCRLYIDTIGDILDKDMVNMTNYKARLSFYPLCVSQLRWSGLGLLCQSGKRSQSVAIRKR
jgi:RhoGEF domain